MTTTIIKIMMSETYRLSWRISDIQPLHNILVLNSNQRILSVNGVCFLSCQAVDLVQSWPKLKDEEMSKSMFVTSQVRLELKQPSILFWSVVYPPPDLPDMYTSAHSFLSSESTLSYVKNDFQYHHRLTRNMTFFGRLSKLGVSVNHCYD